MEQASKEGQALEPERRNTGEMTADEVLFFDRMPSCFPIYAALKARLERAYPDMTVRAARTQISFRSRYVFALVSLPGRRLKNGRKEYLLLTFGLSYHKESPRIAQAVEPYPNRWTHHVPLARADELDDELMGWLDEAYRFSLIK